MHTEYIQYDHHITGLGLRDKTISREILHGHTIEHKANKTIVGNKVFETPLQALRYVSFKAFTAEFTRFGSMLINILIYTCTPDTCGELLARANAVIIRKKLPLIASASEDRYSISIQFKA